jgi:hypothetical protein
MRATTSVALSEPLAGTRATAMLPAGEWRGLHYAAKDPLWSGSGPELRAVHGVWAAQSWVGWLVGDRGALAYNDGTGWRVDTTFAGGTGAPAYRWRDVFVIAPNDVWIVGEVEGLSGHGPQGVLAHHDGKLWRRLTRDDLRLQRLARLNAVHMLEDPPGSWTGWAVGELDGYAKATILRFESGQWGPASGPNNIADALLDVQALSANEAWAVGLDGAEAWYYGQGTGWPRRQLSGIDDRFALSMTDRLSGWNVGEGGRMNKYIGGCHDDDPRTECWFDNRARPVLDFSGVPMPVNLWTIHMLARDMGWTAGQANARRSVIAYYDGNPADDWRRVRVVDDPGVNIYGLHMASPHLGWAVGAGGAVLRYVEDATPTSTMTPSPEATSGVASSPTPTASTTSVLGPWPTTTPVGAGPTGTSTLKLTTTATQEASHEPACLPFVLSRVPR